MRSVLIVDDEPMIREGLRTLIDWEKYGYEVAGLARNGKEGYEKFRSLKPDLIIADIKMPEMDGITLLENIREQNKRTRFILLSGYADFDYAKRAISCGAEAYLLKPIDEEELIDKLIELQASLPPREQAPDPAAAWKELFQEMERDPQQAFDHFTQQGVWTGPSRLLVVKPGRHLAHWQKQADSLAQIAAQAILFSVQDVFIFVLPPSSHTLSFLKQLGEAFPYHAASSTILHEVEDCLPQWTSIQQALADSFYVQEESVLTPETEAVEPVLSDWNPGMYRDRFCLALEASNADAVDSMLEEAAADWRARRRPEQEVKKEAASLCSQIINKMAAAHPKKQTELLDVGSKAGDVFAASSLAALQDVCRAFFASILSVMDDGTPDSQMKKMTDLIHARYSENLKLETLAGIFNYNSAYLGKLFKSHTGEYFNTYVDKVRVEKAKELLNEGYKVYEAAEKVGYANVDYFHRKFKKHAGVSPTAFKHQHGK